MRKPYPSSSHITLTGLFLVASCSIIAEVDRTKIPQDAGTGEGGESTGGSSGTSGTGGKGGTSGASGTGGQSGSSGTSGTGGQGGSAGDPGGMGGEAGDMGAGQGGGGGVPMAVCGDGVVEDDEECDDDGVMPMDGCDANCDEEAGWNCNSAMPSVCNEICGDRVIVGDEVCDDGNNNNCGTCRQGCTMAVTPTAATGNVTPIVDATHPVDGDTFILDDGTNPAVTFEFDADDSVTNSATLIAVDFTGASTLAEVRDAIIAAVNGAGGTLAITAAVAGVTPGVALTNDRSTSLGNTTIGGTNSGSYTPSDMAGGLAGDCGSMLGCTPVSLSSNVCASGECNSSNLCTAP